MAALTGRSDVVLANLSADDFTKALQNRLGEEIFPIYWTTGVLDLIISPITIVANGFIIIATIIDPLKNLQANPSSTLILNLALSDFHVGILFGPLKGFWFLYFAIKKRSPFSVTVLAVIDSVLVPVSVFVLLSLSVDRYIAVTTPMQYSRRVTKKKVLRVSLCIWAYSTMLGVLVALLRDKYQLYGLIVSSHIGLSFCVLLVLNTIGIVSLRKQGRFLREANLLSGNKNSLRIVYERERKVTRAVCIVIAAFQATFLPYITISVLLFKCFSCLEFVNVIAWLYHLATVMVNVNSLINPFLYGLRVPKYRQALQYFMNIRIRKNLTASGTALNQIHVQNNLNGT